MAFKKILYVMSLLLILAAASSTDIDTDATYYSHKLSPKSLLGTTQSEISISPTQRKKINKLTHILLINKDNREKLPRILLKSNPLISELSLKTFIKKHSSVVNLLSAYIYKLTENDKLTSKICTKIIIPFLKSTIHLEKDDFFTKMLHQLFDQLSQSDNISKEIKKQIVTLIVHNVMYSPEGYRNQPGMFVLCPILNDINFSDIIIDNIFPAKYKTSDISLMLSKMDYNLNVQLFTYIINWQKELNPLSAIILKTLTEPNSLEKKQKIIDFLNQNYKKIDEIIKFCNKKKIPLSDAFIEFIIKRRQMSLLKAFPTQTSNESHLFLLKKAMTMESIYHKKHNTVKEAISAISTIFYFDQQLTDNNSVEIDRLIMLIDEFNTGKTGNKKFLSELKQTATKFSFQPVVNITTEMIAEKNTNKAEIKEKVTNLLNSNEDIYITMLNLCDIYTRIKNLFPTTAQYIKTTVKHLIDLEGDTKKLNNWLYKQAPWNKEAYNTLIANKYKPELWTNSFKQTYFSEENTRRKAEKIAKKIKTLSKLKKLSQKKQAELDFLLENLSRIEKEEPKIIIEFDFDFLKDSYSGVPLHDCFSPNKSHEVNPLITALETNSIFVHVYNQTTGKLISSIMFVLTEQGLVDMGFPTGSPNLEEPIFDTMAMLIKQEMIPAIYVNSEKTAYVSSATYKFASSKKLLNEKQQTLYKKEPWILKNVIHADNPRHYATGKNLKKENAHYGVFKTSYVIDKKSIKNHISTSLENLKSTIKLNSSSSSQSPFFEKLRQNILKKANHITSNEEQSQYISNTMPSISVLKKYMHQHSLLPENLHKHMSSLNKILAEDVIEFINKENNFKPKPLNHFFAALFSSKKAQTRIPASA